MKSDDNYTNVLLEDMNAKFDRLIEAFSQMRDELKTFSKQADVEEIKTDVKVIKAAVTDLSKQVDNHETRITQLEAV